MSSAEQEQTTSPGRQNASQGPSGGFEAWRAKRHAGRLADLDVLAALGAPGAVPCRLDPPGSNCQPSETTQGVAVQVAALLARLDERPAAEVEWWADLEYVWRSRRAREVERWSRRAAQLRAAREAEPDADAARLLDRRSCYAASRATAQAMPREARLGTCRRRWIAFGCGCQRIERPVGCDVTLLCEWCRRRHLKRWRRRITKALAGSMPSGRPAASRSCTCSR